MHTCCTSVEAVAGERFIDTINIFVYSLHTSFAWVDQSVVPYFVSCCFVQFIDYMMDKRSCGSSGCYANHVMVPQVVFEKSAKDDIINAVPVVELEVT